MQETNKGMGDRWRESEKERTRARCMAMSPAPDHRSPRASGWRSNPGTQKLGSGRANSARQRTASSLMAGSGAAVAAANHDKRQHSRRRCCCRRRLSDCASELLKSVVVYMGLLKSPSHSRWAPPALLWLSPRWLHRNHSRWRESAPACLPRTD